ncbi:gigasin-6-like [Mytilus californianus]|uniref:gigasin-6-like n=1 Tax=Mytilus californianus TaxID=6549 RepID=UPI002246CE5E|nr:gigasin-6-like [Mytilus californianus]
MYAVCVFIFLSVSCNVIAGSPDCFAKIDTIIQETFRCKSKQIVGVSVAVVSSGNVILEKGYGVKDIETNDTVTADTLFGVASLSKAFASTLLVKLIEENTKYSLNTKVSTIFKNEGIFLDSLRSKYATIRDLLSHKLGIPGNNRIRLDNNLTRANVIHRLKYLQSKGSFRDSFFYNNLIYGVLTHIAELIGRESWEKLVKTHLFDPIGMNSSSFLTTADFEKIDLAKGYIDYYGNLKPVPFEFSRRWADLCGSGCVLSSARDMAKWMKFYLDEGKLADGTRLISKEAFKDLTRPGNVIATTYTSTYFTKPKVPVTTSNTGYALGWRTGHYRGINIYIFIPVIIVLHIFNPLFVIIYPFIHVKDTGILKIIKYLHSIN